jgi:integrase/recombinase XerD
MPDRRRLRRRLIEAEVPVDPGTLGDYARRHLRSLEVRNFAAETIRDREKNLRYFLVWANERAITRPADVSVTLLERYQQFNYYTPGASGRRLSFRAQSARLLALRVFFRWLVRQNVLEMSPAELLELPQREHRLPKNILTMGEVESLLATCEIKSVVGLRDRAMLELLYSSGLRRAEVCALHLWDVNTSDQIVSIRQAKNRKDRIIPMSERAAIWLRKYIDEARPQLADEPDSGHLFLTVYRVPLVPDRVSEIARNAGRAANLSRSVSSHAFRHAMATMMLDGGADIRFVQAMLGHADLSSTEIYTHVAIRKLKQVHAMSHPAAKFEPLHAGEEIDQATADALLKDQLLSSLAAEAAEEESSR